MLVSDHWHDKIRLLKLEKYLLKTIEANDTFSTFPTFTRSCKYNDAHGLSVAH